jgi:hypothetical protein
MFLQYLKCQGAHDPQQVEAMAMLRSIHLARDCCFTSIEIETGCMEWLGVFRG